MQHWQQHQFKAEITLEGEIIFHYSGYFCLIIGASDEISCTQLYFLGSEIIYYFLLSGVNLLI